MHGRQERDRAVNVVGAFALAAADAVRQAAEQSLNHGGSAPAALVTIGAYPGRSIEQLRRPLGLSQPGALRLVERLEHEGWVERRAAAGRGVALSLTKSGQKAVGQLLKARETSLRQLLDHLPDSQLREIAGAAEAVLGAQTESRLDLERLCRLCHRAHCPSCPVSGTAHE
jgi:MarR family transcriptional regulator, negative regulator of the multidrug operon emrRAB